MAKGKGSGETVGGLYIRLGLNYDELNQDFVNVEETISANVQRINRESRLVRLKAEIDLTGVTDASERLKIQQQALTQEIEKQVQKVKLYETEWIAASKAHGVASQQAQKAAISLRQQELELAKLQQRLKEVTAEQQALAKAEQEAASKNSGLLGRYTNIKGDISGGINKLASAFQGLNDASSSADGAIMKTLEIIDAIPSPVGKAVAALASIPLVVKGIENSLLDLAKPAVSAGDSFYAMARGLQMNMADAAKFNMICKVTGIEVSEVVNTTKRLQSQIVKAGKDGNTLTKALERYGVEARKATGELKDAYEMSLALAEGLKRAQALGESRQFIASLGRGISGDYITYLEDLSGNIGLAASVVKNGLADPALAHNIQGNMNAMNAQAAQLSSAFSSAFMPIADVIVPQITARMGELVKIIEENADAIKDAGFAIADMVTVIGDATTAVIKFGLESAKYLQNPKRVSINGTLARYKDDADSIKSFNDFIEKELQRLSDAERILIESSPQQLAAFKNHRADAYAKLKEAYESAAEARKKAEEEAEAARKKLEDTWKAPFTDEEFQASLDRVKKINDELAHIKIDLKFGDDSYGKALAELELRYQQALEQSNGFVREQKALAERYGAERALIEKRHAEEIVTVREESLKRANDLIREAADTEYGLTHDAFEKQLYDIERWKDAQLEKAQTAEEVAATIADAAMKEADAFEREMDRIQGRVESGQDRLARLTLSQRDYYLYKAFKDYQNDLKDLPRAFADTIYRAQLREIDKRASNDKSGNYTQGSGFDASALIYADPRKLAAVETLKKYDVGTEELKRAIGNTSKAQEAYRNILQKVSAGMSAESNSLQSAMEGASNATSASSEKIQTAADVVKRALEFVANIEETNAKRQIQKSSPAENNRIPIIYGNEDTPDPTIPPDKRIEIIYGNEDDISDSDFEEPLPDVAEIIRDFAANMDSAPVEEFQQQIQQATDSVANIAGATENLADAAETAGTSTAILADKFNQTADTLDTLREKIENLPAQSLPQQSPSEQPSQPDSFLDAIANTAQTLRELANAQPQTLPQPSQPNSPAETVTDLSAIQQPLTEISNSAAQIQQILTEISQTLNTVAQAPPQDLSPLQQTLQQITDLQGQTLTTIQQLPVAQEQSRAETQSALQAIVASQQQIQQIISTNQQTLSEISTAIQGTESLSSLAEIPSALQQISGAAQQLLTAQEQTTADLQQLSTEVTPALAKIATSIQSSAVELSQRLSEVAHGISALAQSIPASQNRQPPQVNVNVSPHINLGGAYVFDSAMKRQLTDDITTEVANGVTAAVRSAVNQSSYGYGN